MATVVSWCFDWLLSAGHGSDGGVIILDDAGAGTGTYRYLRRDALHLFRE